MLLELEQISKNYGKEEALKSFSRSFESGQVVGLLGPNGAGKSTLMKIVTGYISPTCGKVTIDGIPVSKDDTKAKQLVGYLPEHNPLYLDMFVKEYLNFVAEIYGIKSKERKKAVEMTINKVGLTEHAHKTIRSLSKGYRQRVGLAAAIIHNPKILILDEPTTGLDPNQIEEIRQLIVELSKERLVLFSTHIMQEVEQICQRVIILNHGTIVVDDNKDALMNKYGSMEALFRDVTK